jgi:putative membrane protein
MKKLLSQIIASFAGLWIASSFVPGVIIRLYPESSFFGILLTSPWQIFLVLGIILGLLNFFVRPILKTLSLPLEILTLGLFSMVINMAMLWLLDIMFAELYIPWLWPLFYTTIIIWALNLIIQKILIKKDK